MTEREKIAYLILSVFVILVFFYFVIQHFKNNFYKRQIEKSREWCTHLGFCTYIVGKIRAGKTTLMAGLTNYIAENLQEKAKDQIKTFCTIFHEIDMNHANEIIKREFLLGNKNTDEIVKKILTEEEYKKIGNDIYFNYLKKTNGFILLKSYVDAYSALLRDNYVYYFKQGFISQFNERRAMDYAPDMLKIKDRALSNDFNIERYSVIAEDEKQASGRGTAYSTDYKKEDSGIDTFKRFIGHFGHESIYYLTTSQVFDDDTKAERGLASGILCVENFKIINPFRLSNAFFHFVRNVLITIIKIKAYALNEDYTAYFQSARCASLKHTLFKVNQQLKKRFAKSFLKYNFIKYANEKDLFKKVENTLYSAEEVELYFPIKYCFGSINTFEFDFLYDYLTSKSKIKGKKQAVESDEQLASEILMKRTKNDKKGK